MSDLNETVEGQSAKEGSVEFAMPESVQQVVLQIRQGNDVSELRVSKVSRPQNRLLLAGSRCALMTDHRKVLLISLGVASATAWCANRLRSDHQ